MYLKELEIGNVKLVNNIMLAPMAGITDLPFRIICKEHGVGLSFTEMASSKAIYYNDKKTKDILKVYGEQRPIRSTDFWERYRKYENSSRICKRVC